MPKRNKSQKETTNAKRQYCAVRPVECDGSCKYAKKKEGC
jgi:hypothetical protein